MDAGVTATATGSCRRPRLKRMPALSYDNHEMTQQPTTPGPLVGHPYVDATRFQFFRVPLDWRSAAHWIWTMRHLGFRFGLSFNARNSHAAEE